MPKDNLLDNIRYLIDSQALINPGDRVLVAISGGPDSVFLFHALMALRRKLGISLVAGHLNHVLRGPESDRDHEFVKSLAKKNGVKLVSARRDVAGHARRKKLSLETAARELRRDFLEKGAVKHHCQKIATGHTLNDQAETVLMHIIRGSGLAGLKGIPLSNGRFVRPLLEVSREEIVGWLRSQGLSWREDATNLSREYLRNRVRLELIPELEKYNPRIIQSLSRLGQAAGDDLDLIEEVTTEAAKRSLKFHKAKIIIDLSIFNGYNKGLKNNLIRLVTARLAGPLAVPHFDRMEECLGWLAQGSTGSRLELCPGLWAVISYGKATVALGSKPVVCGLQKSRARLLALPGLTAFNGFRIRASLLKNRMDFDPAQASPNQAFFDRAMLEGRTITVGGRRTGETMVPFGSSLPKRIKELFIDAKVPRGKRARWPVIRWGPDVLWLPGIRRSLLAPVDARTCEIIKLELE